MPSSWGKLGGLPLVGGLWAVLEGSPVMPSRRSAGNRSSTSTANAVESRACFAAALRCSWPGAASRSQRQQHREK